MSKILHNPKVIRIIVKNELRYWRFKEEAAPDLQPALADEFGIVQSLVSRVATQDADHRKLTPEEVEEIRERLPRGQKKLALANRFSQRQTARRLGIAVSSVHKILARHSQLSRRAIKKPRDFNNPVTKFLTMRTPTQERHHEAA